MQQKANAHLVGLPPVQSFLNWVSQSTCHHLKQLCCQNSAWVSAGKVHGCEPLLTNCVPSSSASSGKCTLPSAAVCTPGRARQLQTEVPTIGGSVHGQSRVMCWGGNPSLCPSLCCLLVFRHNQNKLWCLMTSSLLWSKHLKKSKVP